MSEDPAGPAESPGSGAPDDDPLLEPFLRVCESLAGFDGPGDPAWVDGYLMAIAASRRLIGTDEWLPRLGGEAFERAHADPVAHAAATLALEHWLSRRRDELEPGRLLDRPDEVFVTPLFDEWTDEDRALARQAQEPAVDVQALQAGYLWSAGFLAAVEDFADDWPEPDPSDGDEQSEGFRSMMRLLHCLGADPGDADCRAFMASQWKGAPPSRDELLDEACFAVQDLRVYWLDHAPRPAPRRVAAAPGRNDPCPCGSGRKYKKCHGAAA
jgi:uncharacterized protein